MKTLALAFLTLTLLFIGISYARKPGNPALQAPPTGCYTWDTTFNSCGDKPPAV